MQIYLPADGATVYEDAVRVTGLVNDIVPGTVNAGQVVVTVNGVRRRYQTGRSLSHRYRSARAKTSSSRRRPTPAETSAHAQITVHRGPATTPRVAIVSGDGQTATAGTPLPEPLTVALLDAAGLPVPDRPVVFQLRQSNGSLDGGRRQVAVETGADGTASVHFTLGTRAGVGAQIGRSGVGGLRRPGGVHRDGAAGGAVADRRRLRRRAVRHRRPAAAAAVDRRGDRLRVQPPRRSAGALHASSRERARLDDGPSEEVVTTDSDGRAIVQFTLDPEEGVSNNVVEARIDGLDPSPLASWTASGMAAGDPSQTSISGVVLDNTNLPVPGATVRIRDTSILTQTDDARNLSHPAGSGGNALPDRRRQHRHPPWLVAGLGVRGHDDPGTREDPGHAGLSAADRPPERALRLRDPGRHPHPARHPGLRPRHRAGLGHLPGRIEERRRQRDDGPQRPGADDPELRPAAAADRDDPARRSALRPAGAADAPQRRGARLQER